MEKNVSLLAERSLVVGGAGVYCECADLGLFLQVVPSAVAIWIAPLRRVISEHGFWREQYQVHLSALLREGLALCSLWSAELRGLAQTAQVIYPALLRDQPLAARQQLARTWQEQQQACVRQLLADRGRPFREPGRWAFAGCQDLAWNIRSTGESCGLTFQEGRWTLAQPAEAQQEVRR